MDGLLAYRDEQPKGSDSINDVADVFFDALSYIWDRVGLENGLDLLTALLEVL
jgi:hypothetical protein